MAYSRRRRNMIDGHFETICQIAYVIGSYR
jgi:hypothetical protein